MGSYALYIAVKVLGVGMRCLPQSVALWIGRQVGNLSFFVSGKRRRIAFKNLCFAFGAELSPRDVMRIVRGVFQNMVQSAVEVMRFPLYNRDSISDVYEIKGEEHMQKANRRGRGCIYLTAHFGNWEMSSYGAAWLGYPVQVMVRTQKHSHLNDYVNRLRERSGCKVITKGFEIRQIISHLKQNGGCGILSDQDSGKHGVWVKFFGRLTSAPVGAFEIAERTGCTVLPTFVVREGGRHVSHILPDISQRVTRTTTDRDTRVQQLAQFFADELQRFIRKYPEQWLWVHKRWKSTPQDRVWVLSDGKPGHLNQSLAVASRVCDVSRRRARQRVQALDNLYSNGTGPNKDIRVSEVTYRSPRARLFLALRACLGTTNPRRAWRWLEAALTPASLDAIRGASADFFISCGASVAPVNRILGDMTSAKTICVMKPVFPAPRRFDLVIAPRHDRMRGNSGSGVLVTDTAPHQWTSSELKRLDKEARGRFPDIQRTRYIGLCIGGRADGYQHDLKETIQLIETLIAFVRRNDWGLLVTTTRRTDPTIETLVKKLLDGCKQCDLLVIANHKNPPGAMQAVLSLSKVLIISEDSFSMISEALGSGRRVVVYRVRRVGTPKQALSVDHMAQAGRLVQTGVDGMEGVLEKACAASPKAPAFGTDLKRIEKAVERLL